MKSSSVQKVVGNHRNIEVPLKNFLNGTSPVAPVSWQHEGSLCSENAVCCFKWLPRGCTSEWAIYSSGRRASFLHLSAVLLNWICLLDSGLDRLFIFTSNHVQNPFFLNLPLTWENDVLFFHRLQWYRDVACAFHEVNFALLDHNLFTSFQGIQ